VTVRCAFSRIKADGRLALTMKHPILMPWLLGLAALTLALPAQSAEPDLATTIARYRVDEAAAAVRVNPLWRVPQKVLLLQFGFGRWEGRLSAFKNAAPEVNVVVATDVESAALEATDADVIIGFNPDICNPRIINATKKMRWLASLSAGVENCMALPVVQERSLMMTNLRGIDSPVIAEHAIALMLALAHGLDRFAVDSANGIWGRDAAAKVPMQMLEGKTMLVAGLGGIGTEVARRASGLGMHVVATREGGTGRPDFVSYIGQPDELLALAGAADVIVSALPLTPQTTGLYNAKFFATLKPNALFINIARGGSVVTADLVAALNAGKLAGAGLDVVDPEPLPANHPLWKAPRVLITPHISSLSDLSGEARWTIAVENLRRYVAGEKLLSEVDLVRGY
jgi:phosphoglycerate dehydrogenase-like enzyme